MYVIVMISTRALSKPEQRACLLGKRVPLLLIHLSYEN